MPDPFGQRGVWVSRRVGTEKLVGIARTAEKLGYGAVWIGGGGEPGVFDLVSAVLDATTGVKVASGIANIWVETPESVTDAWHRIEDAHPGRLYVGLGISHARMIEGYEHPLAKTRDFLDELDAQDDPLPPGRRLIAALGPKMLDLAAHRALGTHPYLVTTTNTEAARAGIGDGVVAAELGVVLEPNLASAREQGRKAIEYYFGLPNYTNNWLRAGFTQDDLAAGGSDRLLDAVLALGDRDAVAARVAEHRAAGADHVCLQILGATPDYEATLRALADA